MTKALAKNVLTEKFTEHDLRAKVASDISASPATYLMGHSDPE
jgi:hypothetical protein